MIRTGDTHIKEEGGGAPGGSPGGGGHGRMGRGLGVHKESGIWLNFHIEFDLFLDHVTQTKYFC